MLIVAALALALTLAVAAAPPRRTSHVPVYRPAPPYHTYAQFKSALLGLMNDRDNEGVLRMTVSKEKTPGGERLYLMQLSNAYKDEVNAGTTREWAPPARAGWSLDREWIPAAATSSPSSSQSQQSRTDRPPRKLRALFTFGEHAREYITVESALHLLTYLLEGSRVARTDCDTYASDLPDSVSAAARASDGVLLTTSEGYRARFSQFVLDHMELSLLPCTNPDGRMHVEQSGDFCWRNLFPSGVDPNRNSGWEFGGPGSTRERGEEYHGAHAWSEMETRFVRDVVSATEAEVFLSVHSGEQQLFVPFVDTASKVHRRTRPQTALELALCDRVVSHKHMGGFLHSSGIGWEMNDYSADGTLFDYFAGLSLMHDPSNVQAQSQEVQRVFCVEMYGGDIHNDCFVQFNPDSKTTGEPRLDARGQPMIHPRTHQPIMQSPLQTSLERTQVFFVRMLVELIADYTGLRYTDPSEMSDPVERGVALRRHRDLCRVEQSLYRARQATLKEKPTAASRVTVQT